MTKHLYRYLAAALIAGGFITLGASAVAGQHAALTKVENQGHDYYDISGSYAPSKTMVLGAFNQKTKAARFDQAGHFTFRHIRALHDTGEFKVFEQKGEGWFSSLSLKQVSDDYDLSFKKLTIDNKQELARANKTKILSAQATPSATPAPTPKPTLVQTPIKAVTPRPQPVKTPVSAPHSNCDSNYSGCVPVASDVDCAGGSGNGPAYVAGPVRVIGRDIYDLDRDHDGIGCN